MKIKNVMLWIVGGLLTLTVATISCSKDSGGGTTPTTPTITGISPSSGPVGTVVTISGTNLTGATVTFGSTSATPTSVAAGSIVVPVPAGLAAGAVTVTVTASGVSKTTTFTVTTVAPVRTSDSVATANLIAHWTFDADSKEKGSGISALTGGTYNVGSVTYSAAGQIGNCATFTAGALVYPAIPAINADTALESYTVSEWVNMPVNTGAEGLRSLFQVNGNRFPDLFGLVALELVNGGAKGDTLALQGRQIQVDGNAPYVHNQTAGSNDATGNEKWTFVTMTYDGNGSNQTLKLYADGNLIQTQELTSVTKPETFRIIPTGGSATPTPANMVTIGTFEFNDFAEFQGGDGYGNFTPTAASRPWAQNGITGKIDDVRLFNRALTAAEVTDLYTLGSTGK